MNLHPIWNDYPILKEELSQLKNMVESKVFIRNRDVNAAAKNVFRSSGKMIRPAYSLLFSQLGPESEQERARDIAAAIEIFHNATLLHDDIIDDGDFRRGNPTIQAEYGKKSAVYAGDYLLSICFRITHPYRHTLDVQGLLTRAMEKVIGGELQQLNHSYNYHITIRQYLTQIRGKTAELFGLACFGGAMESNLSEEYQWLSYRIGVQIGMAFQLMDDLLDYTQVESQYKKPLFQDIKNGVYTAPIIFSMKYVSEPLVEILKKQSISEKDIQAVQRILSETNGIKEALELAEKYTNKALELINRLPEASSKMDIERLTRTLLNRTH